MADILDAAAFYASRKLGNREALLENRVKVLPVIEEYVATAQDRTIGGYSSFCFLQEQGNGDAVVAATITVLDELLRHETAYRTPMDTLHFHTHVHAYPSAPEKGGVLYDAARVARFLEISHKLITATPCFAVQFKGIACTQDAVLVCGYGDPALDELRQRFYEAMERYPDAFILPAGQTIDNIREKYEKGIAAVAGARLLAQLQNSFQYVTTAESHAETYLGTLTVTHLTFTANNGWIDLRNSSGDRKGYQTVRIPLR